MQWKSRINSKNIDFFARESALSNNINTYQKQQFYAQSENTSIFRHESFSLILSIILRDLSIFVLTFPLICDIL